MFTFSLEKQKYKKIHFIGIGGVSMSGIAILLQALGYEISGSDMQDGEAQDNLREHGIKIHIGQSKDNITDQDLFIYTDAISEDNEELIAARNTGKEVISRGVILGAMMKNYKRSIAVSGSHGKSSTTSMLTKILVNSKTNASILLGGMLDEIDGNVLVGDSEYFLTEACEYKANILHYYPQTAIILNIDADHLDYYKDLDQIVETFRKYVKQLDNNSNVILNIDDKNNREIEHDIKCNLYTYGQSPDAMFRVTNVVFNEDGFPSFDLEYDNKIDHFELNVLGNYNIINAPAAIIAAYINGIPMESIKESLKLYRSLHRRMEIIGYYKDTLVINDYGHHPSEIKQALETVKEHIHKNIIVAFQSHTYSRTKSLLNEFSQAFDDANLVISTTIYPAREDFDPSIKSEDLVNLLNKRGIRSIHLDTYDQIEAYLRKNLTKDDVLITLGAGPIDVLAKNLVTRKK